MTSSDDDYGQASNNNNHNSVSITSGNQHNNTNRRMNSNNTNPYSSSTGIEIRALMTSRDAGAVIGKGGSSIQKLRADHPRTIIQVPDCASPERVLIINGEQDQCFDALQQIIPALTDSSRLSSFNRRRNLNAGGENSDQTQSNNDSQITGDIPSEVRILVYQIYCGAIIGKGGQHVKELRQTYNLDIKVFSLCCPLSHERVISLRGKVDDIIECIKHIYSLMSASSQQPRGALMIQYDPHSFDIYTVNEYGGFPPPGIDNRTGYNPRGPFSPGGPRGGMYPIQPLPPLVDVPFGGGPGLGARCPNPVLLTSTRVTLPNELVGAIIGPRGAKIQQIRQATNANIIIDDQPIPTGTGGGDRIITIEGTPEQISRAQALLQQAVRQSGLWRP
ncbi:unnamed protein product [Rotaria magnacalcarata]|uniref:K Homology domain-containing protein n=8 Tax=Rotaria magnacalcarata TaxID=392030 RepID=A0A819SJM3_9BILA|nr:unnamed protein product [Rotaria magnacalcarata]CAF1301912.1 unnamed protein product [Rotaria magnacalcarata]CAF1973988.1 unnamed protein product [Rotaria magnacalcarata]CAF2079752.1 unnamed protein product [Rotaria magnacalcarata]CAF2141617.1 unnamed protein product [Rotaria magnacalcarata]